MGNEDLHNISRILDEPMPIWVRIEPRNKVSFPRLNPACRLTTIKRGMDLPGEMENHLMTESILPLHFPVTIFPFFASSFSHHDKPHARFPSISGDKHTSPKEQSL
jgi:hypothetical protein